MNFGIKWIKEHPSLGVSLVSKLAATILIILAAILLYKIVSRILQTQTKSAQKAYTWKRISLYTIVIISIVAILRVWVEGIQTLLTFIGILSAGIAIALKDVFANIAGWLMIVWRNPFNIGDRIQIGDIAGDVVDIRLFQFTLLEIRNWVDADQSTGRLIHVPNSRVFQFPQANYTQGFQYIWNEISVTVTFESNYRKTRDIIETILKQVATPLSDGAEMEFEEAKKRYLIMTGTIKPRVYSKITNSGITLTLRYLVPARQRRDSEHNLWEAILENFDEHEDIALAYPTTRIYYERNPSDFPDLGKPV